MGYEIINYDPVTPHRLHALVRLVSRLENPTRKEILDLLQPLEMGLSNQDTSEKVLLTARHLGLVSEADAGRLRLAVPVAEVEQLEDFRRTLAKRMLGVTHADAPNYLFNLVTAWYAVQNELVFTHSSSKDYATAINQQLFPSSSLQRVDGNKFEGWRDWAQFLGFGWPLRTSGRGFRVVFVPDAYERLKNVLDDLLDYNRPIAFGEFIGRLGRRCPELDGGELFEYCRKLARPGESRSNEISLMLSTALYALHDEKRINLERTGDATNIWQLYPAEGQPHLKQVTRISKGDA